MAVSNAQGMFVAASTRTPELSVPTPVIEKTIDMKSFCNCRLTYLAFEQEIPFSHDVMIRIQCHYVVRTGHQFHR